MRESANAVRRSRSYIRRTGRLLCADTHTDTDNDERGDNSLDQKGEEYV